MTRALKNAAKQILRRYDRRLVHVPRDRASGVDFAHDLRLILPGPHPVCLDVGANVGEFVDSLLATLDRPIVHAFEPSQALFAGLQIRRLGASVLLHNFALGSRDGEGSLTNYESSWMNSLLPLDTHGDSRYRSARAIASEPTPIRTIDGFVEREGLAAIDLLKIDTQGFELEVLRGAEASLRRGLVRTVLVELMFERMYERQASPIAIIEFLAQHGILLVDYYDKIRDRHRLARCNALFMKVDRQGPV